MERMDAAERTAAGTPTGEVVRNPKALALRHDGIDYDAVRRLIPGLPQLPPPPSTRASIGRERRKKIAAPGPR